MFLILPYKTFNKNIFIMLHGYDNPKSIFSNPQVINHLISCLIFH